MPLCVDWLVIFIIWGHLRATPVLFLGLKASGFRAPCSPVQTPLPSFLTGSQYHLFFPWVVTE